MHIKYCPAICMNVLCLHIIIFIKSFKKALSMHYRIATSKAQHFFLKEKKNAVIQASHFL